MQRIVHAAVVATALILGTQRAEAGPPYRLRVDTATSLLRIAVSPWNVTRRGTAAATLVLEAFEKKDPETAALAIAMYDEILGKECLGEEYSALKWFCEYLVAPEEQKPTFLTDPFTARFFNYFAAHDFAYLKEFLQLKYSLGQTSLDYAELGFDSQEDRSEYLGNLIMFANPKRDSWEKSAEVLSVLDLKPGDKVADIGCGFGFYTLRFSRLVGEHGRVYAIDTTEKFLDYLYEFARANGYANVFPVYSRADDVSVADKVDVAFMCSLYHVIYGWSKETERRPFLQSIIRSLKKDGRLVIVDNLPGGGRELHNCYVTKELMEAQLMHYGFRLESYHRLEPLRQIAVFKLGGADSAPPGVEPKGTQGRVLEITSGQSLAHVGSLDSYDITAQGIRAAKLVYKAVDKVDLDAANEAIELYNHLVPTEHFGGEYSALKWFCEYLVASKETRIQMVRHPVNQAFFDYLSANRFRLLKEYVSAKYKFSGRRSTPISLDDFPAPDAGAGQDPAEKPEATREQDTPANSKGKTQAEGQRPMPAAREGAAAAGANDSVRVGPTGPDAPGGLVATGQTKESAQRFLEDLILFNNPRRPEWEETDRFMEHLQFKEGDVVADIGCGSGYYTYRFSKLVGDKGKVYALETNPNHLSYLGNFLNAYGIENVELVSSTESDISVTGPLDVAFMCSVYHIIYAVSAEPNRRSLIESIKRALKKGGTLVIVDNSPVEGTKLPYHGPYVAVDLVVAQLEHYGFKLVEYDQIIPQRYLLKFRL